MEALLLQVGNGQSFAKRWPNGCPRGSVNFEHESFLHEFERIFQVLLNAGLAIIEHVQNSKGRSDGPFGSVDIFAQNFEYCVGY
jgi:hypothetical protein